MTEPAHSRNGFSGATHNDGSSETCPVCPHLQADHDVISRRFCAARIAGGGGRGCVCRAAGQGGPA